MDGNYEEILTQTNILTLRDFDAALAAVHTMTEKAGEGIELTRLRREKARSETQLTKLLAQLGNAVYEKVSEKRLDDVVESFHKRSRRNSHRLKGDKKAECKAWGGQ